MNKKSKKIEDRKGPLETHDGPQGEKIKCQYRNKNWLPEGCNMENIYERETCYLFKIKDIYSVKDTKGIKQQDEAWESNLQSWVRTPTQNV